MDINLDWDSSVVNAPSGFETAIEAAADYLDDLITNNITVNIDVGWGEDDGESLGSGVLGEGGPYIYGPGYSYSQIESLLSANATSPAQKTAVADLPATDPTNGGTFYLSAAQEKAFGLMPANATEIDGTVGFSSTADWDYNPNDRAVPGEYDLVGTAEHELTHALGRIYGLGALFGSSNYTLLDLFRYSAPGTMELTAGQPAYFSINGGTTALAQFATSSDDGDWASTNGPDSFDAFVSPGVENPVTPVDITELNVLGFDVAPCFLHGSRVLTPHGERAVERLAVGDSVITAAGRIAPVAWIGERTIDCLGHPAGEKVWPVRIRAGAFAAGKPAQDLLLSPSHAVFCAGVLVPVQHLVNGATVVQEERSVVQYLHIELDRHDILLADGLEVESYLDSGNRAQFTNGAAHVARLDLAPADWGKACAPFRTEGAEVAAARRRLLDRTLQLGWRVAAKPELRLLADGEPVALIAVEGERHRFVLPHDTREIRILSAAGVPAWFEPASEDRRKLGASIGAIWIGGEGVALNSPALAAGFCAMERDGSKQWRWTNGEALLVLPRNAGRSGWLAMDLLLCAIMPLWQWVGLGCDT